MGFKLIAFFEGEVRPKSSNPNLTLEQGLTGLMENIFRESVTLRGTSLVLQKEGNSIFTLIAKTVN
jgi:hypothetical protein